MMSVCGGLLGATRRVFGVVLVFGWLVCVFLCVVCGVWCFRHAGVFLCFVGFVGWWLGGWFAWVVLVVYVVLLLPLAGRLPLGVGFVGCVVVV